MDFGMRPALSCQNAATNLATNGAALTGIKWD
jgi:hypothetical protein